MDAQAMQDFMARAKAIVEARKNRPAESFWPNVKNWLVSHEGNQPLPTCPVCYTELDVQGIDPVPALNGTSAPTTTPSPSPSPDHDDDHSQSTCDAGGMASVLPCGHMMCHNCLLTTMEEMNDNTSARCPVCRAACRSVEGLSCGHRVHYHVAMAETETEDDPNWIQRIPLTIPEGGSIPERCWAYVHIYPEILSEGEEVLFPDREVAWDLLLLEDQARFEGQTVIARRRNVPGPGEVERERVDEPNDTAVSNDGEASPADPALFEELRTARPQNGRVTHHHCCYYDSIFRIIHQFRSYEDDSRTGLPPATRQEPVGFSPNLWDVFHRQTDFEEQPEWPEFHRTWRNEGIFLDTRAWAAWPWDRPIPFVGGGVADFSERDGDNEVDNERVPFDPIFDEIRLPWVVPWRPVPNGLGPHREEWEDGVDNRNRAHPDNPGPRRRWSR